MIVSPEIDAVTPASTWNTRLAPPPLTVTPAAGPVIVSVPVVLLSSSWPPVRVIVCGGGEDGRVEGDRVGRRRSRWPARSPRAGSVCAGDDRVVGRVFDHAVLADRSSGSNEAGAAAAAGRRATSNAPTALLAAGGQRAPALAGDDGRGVVDELSAAAPRSAAANVDDTAVDRLESGWSAGR